MTSTELNDKELAYLGWLGGQMQDMDDITPGFQAMLYGDSGAGKTVAAMMIAAAITPADKLILHVDTAQGYKVRNNHPRLMERKFHRVPFTGLPDLMKLGDFIKAKAGFLKDVGAIIFDESTTISGEDVQVVLERRVQYKKPDVDPQAVSQPDWGQAQTRFMRFVSKYARLDGVHCIHLAHVRSDNTPTGGVQYSPSYAPKLGAQVRQPMDLISYLTISQEGQRVFQNAMGGGIIAKSRVKDLSPISDFKELVTKTKTWLDSSKAEPEVQETIDPMDITQEMEI